MLALLNDGAILSIAYDNVRYRDAPEAWDMRTVLGSPRCWVSSGRLRLRAVLPRRARLRLDRATIQTLMYLKLSVAGHLTIFLARTRGPFWSTPHPARILLTAVLGTQAAATLIAVFGVFMTPIGWGWALFGWGWALFAWGYALVWFLVNDRFKLLAYRFLDPNAALLRRRKPRDPGPWITTPPRSRASRRRSSTVARTGADLQVPIASQRRPSIPSVTSVTSDRASRDVPDAFVQMPCLQGLEFAQMTVVIGAMLLD